VLVMYTYAGDADLTGKINGDDYFRIDQGYATRNNATPLLGYENGDFNYDGRIDADDYFIIDRTYGRQGVGFSASAPVMGDGSVEGSMGGMLADSTGSLEAVPEPGVWGVVVLGTGLGWRRRKRR
jgi:hypothetical protein